MRTIGKGDIEFYHATMVLNVAHKLATKPWDQLSYRSKQRLLDKSVDIIHGLLNNIEVQKQLRIFLSAISK
jgi:hypothetical protein